MIINILTLFPSIFDSVFEDSILKRAQNKKIVKINIIDIRNFASDARKSVDDKPYGGGAGMILKVDVISKALNSIKPKPYTVLLSANGKLFNQKRAKSLSSKKNIALICGHYEGIDSRVVHFVDEVLSIGDFIMTGGEIPAMAIADSVTRLIPGVIKSESLAAESFENGLLEHPQYTRPPIFKNHKVPQILLKGNHKEILAWKEKESQKITKKNRPDLVKD